jgi:methylphosphotriester-DNA--protein-cysteine methyltransferase
MAKAPTGIDSEEMVRAMRECDADYDGRFWVGVHSTGIYCLPSCRARAPKLENVRFYATREEAVAAGLRACLRCRPERFPDRAPAWFEPLLRYMRERVPREVHEGQLAKVSGQSIATVRRHFREQLGTSPMAWQRRLRLEYAKARLAAGADLLATAYECGFESPSGFRDAFRREFGHTPGARREA